MNVLITGASGFIGRNLASVMRGAPGLNAVLCGRRKLPDLDFFVDDINSLTDWSAALVDIDVVVHVAGSAHRIGAHSSSALSDYRRTNTEGTLNLARQSAAAGVKRFIFISTIGVNGNISSCPFTAEDSPNPLEPYAQSKLEAEQGLWGICQGKKMELVIIRPPLVYGAGAPGNFGRLVRWIELGIPLPLGSIYNKRSFVSVDNLVELIVRCVTHPNAANQVLLAGDGDDISTTDLLLSVAKAMGRPARLIPVPIVFLKFFAKILGKEDMMLRLVGSLQVDISKTCELLDWKPIYTVGEGLRRCFQLPK